MAPPPSPAWVRVIRHLGEQHAVVVQQMRWQIGGIMYWLPSWLAYIGSLGWDEWMNIDHDLQQLFILLDYEFPGNWYPKILCNPKYIPWIAKLVVFCINHGEFCTSSPFPCNGTPETKFSALETGKETEPENHTHTDGP